MTPFPLKYCNLYNQFDLEVILKSAKDIDRAFHFHDFWTKEICSRLKSKINNNLVFECYFLVDLQGLGVLNFSSSFRKI
jgi:hypothetical protein